MRKLLILPLLFAAACDGGSGPAGGAELTAAEAAELSRAMFSVASDLASSGLSGAGFNLAPREAENGFTVPIEETVPCTPSGRTDIEGTVTVGFDDVTMGISMEADISAAPQACAHRLENGDVIKVTGDPDLDIHLVMAGNAEELTVLQVTETGAFKWTRGGASGRCSVNLASSLNAPTQMVTVSGTFCGFPVAETFPIDG
ncbi:MAG TPA: hypothetical protein VEQ60_24885 [Longimicrobium sp.]|nr:hypothetical protein [Longimicrobium sp.]